MTVIQQMLRREGRCALVSTSKYLFIIDLDSGAREVVDQGHGLYYGISWDERLYYVAARNYPKLMPTSTIERPRLLLFDAELRLVEVREFGIQSGGLHQILAHQGKLFCSCSREDRFLVGDGERWEPWYPSDDSADHDRDTHHFNSIWINHDRLYVVGHNNGPSDVWEFTFPNRRLLSKFRCGDSAHNVWREPNGALNICNSANGTVETIDGEVLCEVGGFPRGVAIGDGYKAVGISSVVNRSNRWVSRGWVRIYDESWRLELQIDLGLCGQVNEVRILDGDLAHNGLPAP